MKKQSQARQKISRESSGRLATGSSLTSEILSGVRKLPKVNANWFERLPLEAQQEIRELRQKFQRGEIDTSARRLGIVISQVLKERGLAHASTGVTREWLTRSGEH